MAKLENIDINKVPATGKGGRVTKEDLINFKKGSTSASPIKESKESKPVQVESGQMHSARSFKIAPLTGVTEKD